MRIKITQTTITINDIISKVANTATTILLSSEQLLAQFDCDSSGEVDWAEKQ